MNDPMLLPCPFCGGSPQHDANCYFELRDLGVSKSRLYEAWNRRAAIAAASQQAPKTLFECGYHQCDGCSYCAAPPVQQEPEDFHRDGLGLALFIVHRPGYIPRIGRPGKDIVESLKEWFHANPGADIYVLRTWSNSVGCQSLEDGRDILLAEGIEIAAMPVQVEQK